MVVVLVVVVGSGAEVGFVAVVGAGWVVFGGFWAVFHSGFGCKVFVIWWSRGFLHGSNHFF